MIHYEPKYEKIFNGYYWQEACAGGIVMPYILVHQIYDRVRSYDHRESQYYRAKWFETKDDAIYQLNEAFKKLANDIELFYYNLPEEKREELFPKLKAIYDTGDFIWRKDE